MSIQLKSPAEIAKLREANLIVADVLDTLEAAAKPGMSTWELNDIADKRAQAAQGRVGLPRLPRLPGRAVHVGQRGGGPRHPAQGRGAQGRATSSSIDFGAFKDGWCGDSARTIPIGEVTPGRPGADATRPASRWSGPSPPASRATGWATSAGRSSRTSRPHGYSVVRQFVGHGIGRADARGAPRPELRRGRARGGGCPPAWWSPSSRWSTPGAPKSWSRTRVDGCNQRW